MATNLSKLKRGKGQPPAADETPDVISEDTREGGGERQRPLQVRIPDSVFLEFSEAAAREFGYSHGAKKQMFLRIWRAYKARSM